MSERRRANHQHLSERQRANHQHSAIANATASRNEVVA